MNDKEKVTITSLILANHVENVNGLLYVSGGGWTDHFRRLTPEGNPPTSHVGIGVGLMIPWNETNTPHELNIIIENDDASVMVGKMQAQFNVGRPPTIPQGALQPLMIAMTMDAIFPSEGGYRVIVRLDADGETKVWPFRVHDVPATIVQTSKRGESRNG